MTTADDESPSKRPAVQFAGDRGLPAGNYRLLLRSGRADVIYRNRFTPEVL